MEVVDQRFENGFTPLQMQRTGTDGVAELAFDDGIDHFDQPARTVQPVDTSSIDQISTLFALGSNELAVATNGRDDVQLGDAFGIGQKLPVAASVAFATKRSRLSGCRKPKSEIEPPPLRHARVKRDWILTAYAPFTQSWNCCPRLVW
jgi:hypothetical protein